MRGEGVKRVASVGVDGGVAHGMAPDAVLQYGVPHVATASVHARRIGTDEGRVEDTWLAHRNNHRRFGFAAQGQGRSLNRGFFWPSTDARPEAVMFPMRRRTTVTRGRA